MDTVVRMAGGDRSCQDSDHELDYFEQQLSIIMTMAWLFWE